MQSPIAVTTGDGDDTVEFELSPVTSFLDASTTFDNIITKATVDFIVPSTAYNGFENLVGSQSNDELTGDENVNNIKGESGDDLIVGGAGNDILDGGKGSDK